MCRDAAKTIDLGNWLHKALTMISAVACAYDAVKLLVWVLACRLYFVVRCIL